ncbi:MAG: ABC transporter substrate-binding protein [Chloroflexi bacterium]|nr:ABC transporter substrate-binding protein [Chloroflexota bacterium]
MRCAKLTLSLVAVIGLVAGCAPAAPPAAAPAPASKPTAPKVETPAAKPAAAPTLAPALSPKPAAAQPQYGGVLTVGIGADPPSLDIHREESFTHTIGAGTYNGLARYDAHAWPDAKVVPDLATRWELSPDSRVYTFHLVKEAKFHDGSPLIAEDVKFSFDRIRDPQAGLVKSPRRQQLANVAKIDAADDYTVKVTLKNPQASFIPTIAAHFFFAVMPKRVVLEKKNDMTKTIVGSGAFRFKDYVTGVSWELVKNPNYFVKGRPYLDSVKGYIIKDSFTRFAALRTRSILWWSPSPYMSVSQSKILEETLADKVALQWAFHPAWYGAIFNVARPPWNDVRVRQAVSMSFDRKRMLATGLDGAGVVGIAAQPPGKWALPEEELMKAPGYARPDIEGAKKLLAEAGFPNGFKTEALARSAAAQQALALVFKDAVAAIGITVDLNVAEPTVYNEQRFRKAFAVTPGSYGPAGGDPDAHLGDNYVTGSPSNWSGYSNPQYDELYVKQSQTVDEAERRKTVWEMQRILLKDVPIALAYWSRVAYAWWKEVRGYTPPSLGHYYAYMYEEMWLAR